MSPVAQPDPIDAPPEAAERELRSLRLVAMSVAHQLNNTMSGLLGLADLERETEDGSSTLADTVVDECARGISLARALMNVAARSYGKTETVSPAGPLEEVLEALDKYLANNNVSVDRNVGPTPSCTIDSSAVRQAFLEVILYAAGLAGDGGRIRIDMGTRDRFVHVAFQVSLAAQPSVARADTLSWARESMSFDLARQVATDHDGAFEIDESDPSTLQVIMCFPLPPEPQ